MSIKIKNNNNFIEIYYKSSLNIISSILMLITLVITTLKINPQLPLIENIINIISNFSELITYLIPVTIYLLYLIFDKNIIYIDLNLNELIIKNNFEEKKMKFNDIKYIDIIKNRYDEFDFYFILNDNSILKSITLESSYEDLFKILNEFEKINIDINLEFKIPNKLKYKYHFNYLPKKLEKLNEENNKKEFEKKNNEVFNEIIDEVENEN